MSLKLGRKPTDADYGLGEHCIDCDRLGLMDEQELTDQLIRTFSLPSYRPPRLPAVATELLALSQKSDVDFKAMESLLEQDAMLAGEVLSQARSVFYSGTHSVRDLRAALVRLGLRQLRQVVLQAAMNLRVFRSSCYRGCMDRLRRHSQAIAHLCQIVALNLPKIDDRSYLCGLLHDVGIAGILLVLGDVKRGAKAPELDVLWPSIDAAHARAGARMIELWGLPEEIAAIVAAHHEIRIGRADHPTAATVCLAEALAVEIDLGFVPSEGGGSGSADLEQSGLLSHGRIDRNDESIILHAREVLELDEAAIDRIRSEAREWAATAATATV